MIISEESRSVRRGSNDSLISSELIIAFEALKGQLVIRWWQKLVNHNEHHRTLYVRNGENDWCRDSAEVMAYDVTQLIPHHQYFVISHLCMCAHRGTVVCEHKKCTSASSCKQPHDYVISQSEWIFQKLLKLRHFNIIIVMKSSVKMPGFYRCFVIERNLFPPWRDLFFSLRCRALFSHLLTISHFPTRGHYGQKQRHVPSSLQVTQRYLESQNHRII